MVGKYQSTDSKEPYSEFSEEQKEVIIQHREKIEKYSHVFQTIAQLERRNEI